MLGDTDPGVMYRQGQIQPVIANLLCGDFQGHASFLGEFHRIGNQVVEYLP